MTTRLSYLVVLVLLFLSLSSAFSDAQVEDVNVYTPPAPYTPIPNPNDTHVVEIAQYAVTEYNKQSGANLKLVEVLQGETQALPDGSTNYRLALNMSDAASNSCNDYQAIVYENFWNSFKKLISFQRIISN